jgi:hypothetical protein
MSPFHRDAVVRAGIKLALEDAMIKIHSNIGVATA